MKTATRSLALSLLLAGCLAAGATQAETFTGRINGHSCAHGGEVCPIDRLDPHVVLERDFVLQTSDGTYYFMTNLPRDVKVRHVLSEAKVEGALNPRYNTLTVEALQVKQGDAYRTVWSNEQQSAEWTYFLGTGGLGPMIRRP